MDLHLNLTPYTKINSKIYHKFKCKTTKLLEHDIGESLWGKRLGEEFLDMTAKAQSMKKKNLKMEVHNLKSFVQQKTLLRMKRQAKGWKKYLQITYMTRNSI